MQVLLHQPGRRPLPAHGRCLSEAAEPFREVDVLAALQAQLVGGACVVHHGANPSTQPTRSERYNDRMRMRWAHLGSSVAEDILRWWRPSLMGMQEASHLFEPLSLSASGRM